VRFAIVPDCNSESLFVPHKILVMIAMIRFRDKEMKSRHCLVEWVLNSVRRCNQSIIRDISLPIAVVYWLFSP